LSIKAGNTRLTRFDDLNYARSVRNQVLHDNCLAGAAYLHSLARLSPPRPHNSRPVCLTRSSKLGRVCGNTSSPIRKRGRGLLCKIGTYLEGPFETLQDGAISLFKVAFTCCRLCGAADMAHGVAFFWLLSEKTNIWMRGKEPCSE
jgi:hypothetical protein